MRRNKQTKKLLDALSDRAVDPFSTQEGRFSYGRLKDSVYRSGWTEESFLSDSGRKEVVSLSFNFGKLRFFLIVGILAILALVSRAAWLQVVKSDYYYLLSEDNRLRQEIIEPKRGIIYDANFKPLVRNKANFVLYLRPIDLPKDELQRDSLIREVSHILDKGESVGEGTSLLLEGEDLEIRHDNAYFYQIKDLLAKVKIGSLESYRPLFVADNIDYEVALKLNLNALDWPGVFVSNKIRREYLVSDANKPIIATDTSLSHLLGYTGKISEKELESLGAIYTPIDYLGKVGLEYSWEKELKGTPGRKSIEVDALGRAKKVINETPALDGHNLLLSLDLDLQQKAEEILGAHVEKNRLQKASLVIINPNNGEILSLISWPYYNNNSFARGISQDNYQKLINNPAQPLFNRAVAGAFAPASTIKPVFAAAALEEGVINENTTFLSTGGLRISQWYFPDWRYGGHGLTNVRSAISNSVNTFFYYIGGGYGDFVGLGLDGLVKYSRLFGLGERSGVDISGEAAGFVPTSEWKREHKNESWYIGDTYHFGIGQGDLLATPLQVANYTATVANGGTLYKPHLVSKILDSANNVVRDVEPEIIRSGFISEHNMNVVREGMRQTVTSGSGRYLNSLPIEVAAKTGTSQWSSVKNTHAWFVGFAPYDEPELAFAIILEEGGEGSSTAAPVAYDILHWYFTQKDN